MIRTPDLSSCEGADGNVFNNPVELFLVDETRCRVNPVSGEGRCLDTKFHAQCSAKYHHHRRVRRQQSLIIRLSNPVRSCFRIWCGQARPMRCHETVYCCRYTSIKRLSFYNRMSMYVLCLPHIRGTLNFSPFFYKDEGNRSQIVASRFSLPRFGPDWGP